MYTKRRSAWSVFFIRFVNSVDDLRIEVEGVLAGAAVVGEERRAGHHGKGERIDERVCREVGDGGTHVGEHRLGGVDRKDALVLVGDHILDLEHAYKAYDKIEGLGGFVGALDLAFKHHDVDLRILVRLTDLAGEEGFDFKFGIGGNLEGVDLEVKLVCGERFQRVFDHNITSLD